VSTTRQETPNNTLPFNIPVSDPSHIEHIWLLAAI